MILKYRKSCLCVFAAGLMACGSGDDQVDADWSDNADLESLSLSLTSLDQHFDSELEHYTASTGYFGSSTAVYATVEEVGALLTLNGKSFSNGMTIPLQVGVNHLVVDVTAEDSETTRTYSVTILRGSIDEVDQVAYLKASNANEYDFFAFAVDALSGELIVGAPFESSSSTGVDGEQNDNSANATGAAYFFELSGSNWIQATYLKASNSDPYDAFGYGSALSESVLAVGAPGEANAASGIDTDQTDKSGYGVGAVYAFERDGSSSWTQTGYLKASNASNFDRFGAVLAVKDSVLVVGVPLEDSAAIGVDSLESGNTSIDAGAVYVFRRMDGSDWEQSAYVKAVNTDARDEFGGAVALSDTDIAIGARYEDSSANGVDGEQNDDSALDSGAVYIFPHSSGVVADQVTYVKASNPDTGDNFGSALALDATLLAVGAPAEDSSASGINGNQADSMAANSGAVYIFEKDVNGVWSQVSYIKSSTPANPEGFGAAVALRGNLLVVGAPGESSGSVGINGDELDETAPGSGAVYVFERDRSGEFSQIAYIKAANTDRSDRFGETVAIAGDSIVVGAPEEESRSTGVNHGDDLDNSLAAAGAVYIFQ